MGFGLVAIDYKLDSVFISFCEAPGSDGYVSCLVSCK